MCESSQFKGKLCSFVKNLLHNQCNIELNASQYINPNYFLKKLGKQMLPPFPFCQTNEEKNISENNKTDLRIETQNGNEKITMRPGQASLVKQYQLLE